MTYVYYNYKINMNRLLFEWDENKNRKNIIKHGISFEEASSVFLDDQAILFDDQNNICPEGHEKGGIQIC